MADNYNDEDNGGVLQPLEDEANRIADGVKTLNNINKIRNKAQDFASDGWENGLKSAKESHDETEHEKPGSDAAEGQTYKDAGNESHDDSANKMQQQTNDARESADKNTAPPSNATSDAAKEGAKKAAEAGEKATEDADKLRQATEAVAKEGAKQAAQKGAEAAGTAAAGASTAGIAVVVKAAADIALKAGKEALSLIKQERTNETKKSGGGGGCLFVVLGFALLPVIIFAGLLGSLPGGSTVYTNTQANNAAKTQQDYSSSTGKVYDNYVDGYKDDNSLQFYDDNSTLNLYDVDNLFSDGSKTQVQIVDATLQKAHQQARNDVQAAIDANDYDPDLTWESFDRWGYPFTDINFAEFMTVWSENKDFDFQKANQKQFDDYTNDASNLRHLYRLSITTAYKWVIVGYDDDGDPIWEQIKYGKCKYCKYYLKDLFAFAKVDPESTYYNYTGFDTDSYNDTKNIEVLDVHESILRKFGDFIDSTFFGKNERTPMDGGFPAEPATNDYGVYSGSGNNAHSTYGFASLSGLSEQGKANMQTIYNKLLGFGMSEAAAAGLCGNLWQESKFIPTAISGSKNYHGIVQWGQTSSSGYKWQQVQEYAASKGLDVNSAEAQIGYIMDSEIPRIIGKMSNYIQKYGGGTIYDTTNVDLATEAAAVYLEGCVGGSGNQNIAANGKHYQDLGQRKSYASTLFSCKGDPTGFSGIGNYDVEGDGTVLGSVISWAANFVHSGKYKYSQKGNRHGADGTFDCSGLVNTCFKNSGVSVPDTTAGWFNNTDSLIQSGRWIKVPFNQLKAGDVALYKHSNGTGHTGVIGYNNNMLHASGTKSGLKDSAISAKDFMYGMRFIG